MKRSNIRFIIHIVLLLCHTIGIAKAENNMQMPRLMDSRKVSWVDTSLNGSEKYVLRVNGKPFYMTNIQVRLDKLYGYHGWTDDAMEAVVKRAAADGFNTLSIPIHWREVEPQKDKFDWTILDKYMDWCRKYNLKMELLWFSWSSGGRIQYLWNYNGRKEPRTPDYVCSMDGKSEFNILRKEWEYSLDWRDTKLRDRETYVLAQVMEHIAQWNVNNGNSQTVIGIQLGNEAHKHGNNNATPEELIEYYHHVGSAVKESPYIVWTRFNCIKSTTLGLIKANELKRSNGGTNIDFVGVDVYGTNAERIKGNIDGDLPDYGENYKMVMEIDAKDEKSPIYQMAALAGDKAYDYYNMGFVDGNALYTNNLSIHNGHVLIEREHITLVRQRNKILNLANEDIALKKHGANLYVYNFAGNSVMTEKGIEGISFTPDNEKTQAIAIRRSATEIILLSTLKGTFSLPSTLKLISASKGYFNTENKWVDEEKINHKSTEIQMPETSAVLLRVEKGIFDASNTFKLIEKNQAAKLLYLGHEKVVHTAIEILIKDSKLVCDHPFENTKKIENNTIIIGIPEKEPELTKLLFEQGINVSDLKDKWEAYKIIIKKINGKSCLFVLGSDPRGTAYGILQLSREIGISPWVWWADVIPEKQLNVLFTADENVHSPSVQYRGIFLNDEDWALMPWSTRTFEPTSKKGAIGPETYSKIFELLLRLRANTIWPAMHECTIPFFFVEGNKEVAEKYGIVLSTSHAEPMMRTNTGEWDNKKYGTFNFLTNETQVLNYWEERVKQLNHSENIYTIGMRGIHDGRMQGVQTLDDETQVLHQVIEKQREMLARNNLNKKIADIPQIFIPYKEVLKAYENGLNLPDDITLVWCDDNHGYIMRQSNTQEQKRSGGAGVYYHISYWGKPHDYLWLGSTQPGLIFAEMKRAWENGAHKLWILNVGDIKPNEYLTEFFLDMAWDIKSITGNSIYAHQYQWYKKVFGDIASDKISYIMNRYYLLAGQRKPEHMGWNQVEDWSLKPADAYGRQPIKDSELSPFVFGDEIQRRIDAYNEIAEMSTIIYKNRIPHRLKASYFQLIHYPVMASKSMNLKILYAQKSRYYSKENVELSKYYARLATEAYNEISALDYTYNKDILDGKWELMMDMKPRDLPVFQEPVLPTLPMDIHALDSKIIIPETIPLTEFAGTKLESDRMIAINAFNYDNSNFEPEIIEGLGHSNKAVSLPKAKRIDIKEPYLEYKINTTSNGPVKIKIGTIPMHSIHGDTGMRYAVTIDEQKPLIVSTTSEFLSKEWADNVLRNQCLTVSESYIEKPGEHIIRIYSLDEKIILDQLMFEFDLDRKHYLIPIK